MNITEAVQALEQGKVIHCPNSFETMKTFDSDLGKKVECSLVDSKEKQNIYLSRFPLLYKNCDFGMGKHPSLKKKPKPDEDKSAAVPETK